MWRIALKMLMGDTAKFCGILLGLTFAALLIMQQGAIFCGLMRRTAGQINDVSGVDLWVMDPNVRHIDDVKPMMESNLHRVRGVDGVLWAVPLYKGSGRAKLNTTNARGEPVTMIESVVLLGLDDTTLVGAPTPDKIIAGDLLIQLDRLTVRAPIEGDVLQLNVRPGQFAAMTWNEPMIVLGDINRLHVRVDIDENDVPLFDEVAAAMAYFKGRSHGRFPLKFEYVEPYMVPKQSLTGSSSERVDTRVLRVVYSLPEDCQDVVHVGQQMDVYIKVPAERWDAAFDSVGRPSDPFATGSAATPAAARSPGPPVGSGLAGRAS